MENNIENIRVETKVYTNQTSIFIVDRIKIPKPQLIHAMIIFFFIFAVMFTSLLVTTLR